MRCSFAAAALAALLSGQAAAAFVLAPPAAPATSSSVARYGATTLDDINDAPPSAPPIVEAPATAATAVDVDPKEAKRRALKRALLGRLGGGPSEVGPPPHDAVLADPVTKEPLATSIAGSPPILGGGRSNNVKLTLRSSSSSTGSDVYYEGRTDTYVNLLAPAASDDDGDNEKSPVATASPLLSSLLGFAPPPLRSIVANATNSAAFEYVPMRDLFTAPQVSFAYERGWRQGFSAAGFPGADDEYEMAREYFEPPVDRRREAREESVLVDMSCATGLFTRRFAKSGAYSRVIACDYSDAMLTEARRRIRADPDIASASSSTRLDLVRCDVAQIPMQDESVDAFHAGAAMHCWPEIEDSLAEIRRVLVPGGRYFATTFLSTYFNGVANAERWSNGGEDVAQASQAFQYFPTLDYLKDLLVGAGFEEEKVDVELRGSACAIIRCEK